MHYYKRLWAFLVVLTSICIIVYRVVLANNEVNRESDDVVAREARKYLDQLPKVTSPASETCTKKSGESSCESFSRQSDSINIVITFTNAEHNENLKKRFAVTVSSLFSHTTQSISICLIADEKSYTIARSILSQLPSTAKYIVSTLEIEKLKRDYEEMIKPFQAQFSHSQGSYYSHILFFLSIAMHRILPTTVDRVIMLDSDLRFEADISLLYGLFDKFSDSNIIGLAHEQQPVYRHTFYQYRNKHPDTLVGEAGSRGGRAGFNSGVMLIDLLKMRNSELYNSLLTPETLTNLTAEYGFKGHLGDQDFFTLIGMKYPELFYVLPCEWNRQLCVWWQKVYPEIFDVYHKCDNKVMIYHGNCNTPIPDV